MIPILKLVFSFYCLLFHEWFKYELQLHVLALLMREGAQPIVEANFFSFQDFISFPVINANC